MSPIDLQAAQTAFEEASTRRVEAMIDAVRSGVSLREIAGATNCSREAVRRIVQCRAVTFVDEATETEYELTEQQTRVLAYKAAGFGAGAFSGDVQRLNAGTDWPTAAMALGQELDRVQNGLITEPLLLTQDKAFALYQILRLTYLAQPSRLAELRDTLSQRFDPDR